VPVSQTQHQQAIDELLADPKNRAKAQRVFDLARQDPAGAQQAHQEVAPAPALLPLDLEKQPFRRNNLYMADTPKFISPPKDRAELLAVLQRAADAWLQAKAIGDGYGFANTGETRGHLVPMVDKLNRVLEIDRSVLKDSVDADYLCQFEGGATLGTITSHLWQRGKAVFNQPGYENLTFVGTMSSGGHGSGSWCGPLSEHARALQIVTVDADRRVVEFQIEPSDGISDPAKFAAKYPDIELVQDDRMFHACTVAMGCFGVVYSAIIEVRDAYNIRETRRRFRFSDVKPRLPELIADQGPGKRLHSIEVWINPYRVDDDVWCILGERSETHDPPHGQRAFAIEYGGPEFFYRLLSWWLQKEPSAVPFIMDVALSATQASDVVLTAPKGLNFGAPNLAPVTACSCGVPSENIGDLADSLIAFFQDRAEQEGAYITSPVGLRFVKGAKAFLSPAFERDTCMIEVPTLLGTPKARETLKAYHDFLYENYNGRPHWGQVNDMPGDRLAQMYPSLDAFLESFRVLNPKGFFDNAFTEQMGFRGT
jgi:L-gulono-1,4-lactone dehydrogenase